MAKAKPPLSRRSFMRAGATIAPLVALGAASAQDAAPPGSEESTRAGIQAVLSVNGQSHRLTIDPRTTVLDALRERIGLTGTKKGCDHGQCGACTVHVDSKRVLSCLTLAAAAEGHEITTIEGIASPSGELHPMQQAFIDMTASSAAIARPARSCRRSPASRKAMPDRRP